MRASSAGAGSGRGTMGYLVPEYPGQTHAMFATEVAALGDLGVRVQVVSTRPPATTPRTTPWRNDSTRYLFPLTAGSLVRTVGRMGCSGPGRWTRVASAVARSQRRGAGRVRLLGLAVAGAELAALARAEGLTHVHVHSCADAADVARFSRLWGGPAYSLTLHGPLSDYGPDQRAKWAGAEFGTVITDRLRDELVEELAPTGHPPLAVAGMGVDVDALARDTPYEPWDGSGDVRVFSCGRLNPSKGHADLVSAVGMLRNRGVPVRLRIAGEDDHGGSGYRTVLEQLVSRLGLEDAVELLGATPAREVRRHLHAAHVFALASRAEPLGVAIMEAMAAGAPVVSTSAGGVPELVANGRSGILVAPDRPEALASGLGRLIGDGDLARRLASAGAASIRERMQQGSSAAVLVRLLDG